MTEKLRKQIHQYVMGLPGKRGIDIPAEHFDKIQATASAITLPIWGRHPTPEHMAGFYAAGAHENPALIHAFYESQPHPHAPSLKVGEFHAWAAAHKSMKENG